jgi:hypothetical protein
MDVVIYPILNQLCYNISFLKEVKVRNLFIIGLIVVSIAYMFFILLNQYEDVTVKQGEPQRINK